MMATLSVNSLNSSQYPPDLIDYLNIVTTSSQIFVRFHEYGHLVQGHLPIGPCHQVEFDADFYATLHLLSMGIGSTGVANPGYQSTFALGGVFILFALCLIEVYTDYEQPSTHPPGEQRLGQFLSVVIRHYPHLLGVGEKA